MQKKLTIAIMCDSIDTTLGGSYISPQRFAKGLAELGHRIIRCTSIFVEPTRKKDFTYATVYEFSSSFPMGSQHIRFAAPRVKDLVDIFTKEHIDVIYNIHASYIGRQSYRAAKKTNIPLISHSHVYPQLLLPGLPGFLQKWLKNIMARFYRKCDGIIYPTVFAKKDFEEYHFATKEVVISNGVDLNLFHPIQIHESHNVFKVLYVGRLDPEKNIPLLIDALHLLTSQHLGDDPLECTIIGTGGEEKKLRALVQSYGLENVVHFTGKIDLSEVVRAYQESGVYVLASLYELESMSTLEAMACGCPILIADSKYSAAKFFVKENGYLFDPKNPQDLADKINFLRLHPDLVNTMREKSRENVSRFGVDVSINELSNFFLSFCDK